MILGLFGCDVRLPRVFSFILLFFLANTIDAHPAVIGDKPTLSEQQVKAAFLYYFIKFIDWPQEAFPDKNSPILVGVIGDDSLGRELEQSLRNKTINGRELVLRQIGWPGDLKGYHILLLCASEAKSTPAVLASVKGSPVLTVGEIDRFGEQGGIINFYIEEKKVRFEINIDAAKNSRLKISSQLLSLAKIIRDDPRAGRM
jgi:hypothetical protein